VRVDRLLAAVSQNSTAIHAEVDVLLGDLVFRTEKNFHQTGQEPPE
jgi:hypothetical protein